MRAQGVVWLALGVALLTAAGVAIYASRDDSRLRAYAVAPACASLDEALAGNDCRFTTTAIVTDIIGDGGGTDLDLEIPGTFGPGYTARIPGQTSITNRSQVQVEFWMQRVTKVGNTTTADNPASDPRSDYLLEIGLLLALLALGALFMARRLWRDDESQPSMNAALTPVAASDLMNH
jgi:MYXO-CTERM domain-containing protein